MNNRLHHLDAILVSCVPNIIYLTGYSGFSKDEREAFVFITKSKQYLATDGRYIEEVKKLVSNFEIIEITSSNPFKKILAALTKKHQIKKLGIEEKNLTVHEQKTLLSHYNDTYHYSDQINKLRAIKSIDEVAAIEKACALGDKTFNYILTKIKAGVTEKRLAWEIEFFIKKQGADISFTPIVAFGANSAVPHHQTSNTKLVTRNTLILLDFGVKINNYCSDMTRVVFFGKATAKQKRIYETVLQAQKRAIEFINQHLRGDRMGSSEVSLNAKAVDKVSRDYIINAGFPAFPHTLGHGIGLEVHEAPRLGPKSKDKLVPGMVFSIEPGIYIPEFGGVRIEDLVVLKKSGPRLLTKATRKIIEI